MLAILGVCRVNCRHFLICSRIRVNILLATSSAVSLSLKHTHTHTHTHHTWQNYLWNKYESSAKRTQEPENWAPSSDPTHGRDSATHLSNFSIFHTLPAGLNDHALTYGKT